MENFNAGNPPLYHSNYPGSEFPNTCNSGFGYGGHGDYGTYGSSCGGAKPDCGGEYPGAHRPGCQCPQCQAPYSMPYKAGPGACGNPMCNCANCDGNCKCGSGNPHVGVRAKAMADLGMGMGMQFGGMGLMDLIRYAIMAVVAYYIIMYAMKLLRRRR